MSYEPYALKYRPQVFGDTVGQDAVSGTLRNALRENRVANAFLFAGSRGTGKTSMARILAKALNCAEGSDGEPCGSCESCDSIARGHHPDVIEIDGASNRGIDEIRTVRDNVGYAPSQGRFKVYIIDEVHMLTIQAFNALLKTLEEPPPHVKFIFATTEPQAVPETIVSRCQRFEFRRIPAEAIVTRLSLIAEREGVQVEEGVLQQIALKAEGGLRDSTSLLDQVVAFAGERVTQADLDRVVGVIDTEVLGGILEAAGEGDGARLMDALDAAFETGRDAEEILLQLVEVLREAMVREARGLAGGGDARRGALVAAVRHHFPLDRLLFALRICLNARREIKLVGHGRVQLELAALKIARSRDLLPVREILERLERGGPVASEPVRRPTAGGGQPGSRAAAPPASPAPRSAPRSAAPPAAVPPIEATAPAPREAPAVPAAPAMPAAPAVPTRSGPPPGLERIRGDWERLIDALRKRSARVASMLDGAVPAEVAGSELRIALEGHRRFQKEQLEGPQRRLVEEAAAEVFGHHLRLRYDLREAPKEGSRPVTRRVHEDPGVRRIIDNFNGGIIAVDNEGSTS